MESACQQGAKPMTLFERIAKGKSSTNDLQYRQLTPEGCVYFAQVLADYRMLPPSSPNDTPAEVEARKIAEEVGKKEPSQRTWSDLFELEACVTKLEPEAILRRNAWSLRSKYKGIAGKSDADAYEASNPPDPKTANVDELRADALRILSEFHWIYAFNPLREQMRNSITRIVFWLTFGLLAIVLGMAWLGYDRRTEQSVPVLPLVVSMGMIGGFVSLQRRIQAVPSTGDPILNITELSNSKFSVYLTPISGAVFAALLYVIFIGGLLQGPLFPKISSPAGACESPQVPGQAAVGQQEEKCPAVVSFSDFVKKTAPASGAQFAILLVWSFIAGFAERFVPDTIDRLVNKANEK
jgi:hypothetical protein